MINKNLIVEDARIAFRNFSGKESKFNRAGNRNFCIIFDMEEGERLKEEGWNMGILRPRSEDDDPAYKLDVAVSYGRISPDIYMVVGRKKTLLDEHTVGTLDFAEIESVDVVIRPYNWEVNGKTGVKAYVKQMFVVIRQDTFASKYDFNDPEDFGNEPF